MASANPDIAMFEAVARQDASLRWYAIADSAQHRAVPNVLVQSGYQVRCLFDTAQESTVAKYSPHLVELVSPHQGGTAWHWISLNASSRPCVSVIATAMSFDLLFLQLGEKTKVILPDNFDMFFGFWDPAILGTLVGQVDDLTLHVAGPVLTLPQQSALLHEIKGWWYWDRDGKSHAIKTAASTDSKHDGPFSLVQEQVDDLVEASVPDHILYYLEQNQPLLLEAIAMSDRYYLIRKCLAEARTISLSGMRDLVNFACLSLIYGTQFYEDPIIRKILSRVQQGDLSFSDAITMMP